MRLSLALYTWSSFDNQNNAPCTYPEYGVEHRTLSIRWKCWCIFAKINSFYQINLKCSNRIFTIFVVVFVWIELVCNRNRCNTVWELHAPRFHQETVVSQHWVADAQGDTKIKMYILLFEVSFLYLNSDWLIYKKMSIFLPCIDIPLFEIRTRATAHIQLSPVYT